LKDVVVVVVVLNIFWAVSEFLGNAIFVPRVGVYSDVVFLVPVKQCLVCITSFPHVKINEWGYRRDHS